MDTGTSGEVHGWWRLHRRVYVHSAAVHDLSLGLLCKGHHEQLSEELLLRSGHRLCSADWQPLLFWHLRGLPEPCCFGGGRRGCPDTEQVLCWLLHTQLRAGAATGWDRCDRRFRYHTCESVCLQSSKDTLQPGDLIPKRHHFLSHCLRTHLWVYKRQVWSPCKGSRLAESFDFLASLRLGSRPEVVTRFDVETGCFLP
ncbi:unnamed protein product [Symbiodinium necroappetens]|uniref:Uncharacterized protein n=1 Tax=Symbiodinium necroappetens TaxID=1628268 RepID=A0A812NTN2_9DINO|nr:unnamed protein product [Symbiodinium necroappetens]